MNEGVREIRPCDPRVEIRLAEESDPQREVDFFRKWIAILREQREKREADGRAA